MATEAAPADTAGTCRGIRFLTTDHFCIGILFCCLLLAKVVVHRAGIEDVEHHELPTNLNTMEAEQLAAVCASYGIEFKEDDRKSTLIGTRLVVRFGSFSN